MTSLRCSSGHIIDVQFINPSLASCPTCGNEASPANCITGETVQWPAVRLASLASAQAPVSTEPVAAPATVAGDIATGETVVMVDGEVIVPEPEVTEDAGPPAPESEIAAAIAHAASTAVPADEVAAAIENAAGSRRARRRSQG